MNAVRDILRVHIALLCVLQQLVRQLKLLPSPAVLLKNSSFSFSTRYIAGTALRASLAENRDK